jgi:predicted TIM-barrel fold metal-dependent hydrolase
MNIIDFHCHPFYDTQENLCFFPNAVKNQSDDILTDMEDAGISRFCGSVILRPLAGFDTLHTCNLHALELRKRYGDRYIPGFHISPQFIEESIAEIAFAKENGVNLIGELVPYMHGNYPYYSREFSILLEECERQDMLVSLHTMDDLDEMRRMAKAHPHLSFVFAHPGDRPHVLKHIAVMQECDNVSLDISGNGILRYGMLTHVANTLGAERILFGTDYPIGHPKTYVAAVLAEKLTDREKELILSGNAKRLLKL